MKRLGRSHRPADSDSRPAVAVIGLAGRFPGASTPEQFWRNLCAGVESIRHFTEQELDDWFSEQTRRAPNYVKARPVLDNIELFDAEFFGMQAREAELTDPQHRLFLECAWEALEDGGYDPARYQGSIGVFAGSSLNTYFLNNVCRDRAAIERFTSSYQVDCYPELIGAGQDFLATRVAYKLDLKGPALTLQIGLLDLAARRGAGRPEPAALPIGHGAGRRRFDQPPAKSGLSPSGGRHGVRRRDLPALRCPGQRHDLRQRRGLRALEAPGRCVGRRRSHLCRPPRLGRQQRRRRQGRVYGAERAMVRPAPSKWRTRWPASRHEASAMSSVTARPRRWATRSRSLA